MYTRRITRQEPPCERARVLFALAAPRQSVNVGENVYRNWIQIITHVCVLFHDFLLDVYDLKRPSLVLRCVSALTVDVVDTLCCTTRAADDTQTNF